MICPKCGRDNEGNSCPYCDELEIYDRTNEYMARRAQYIKELEGEDEPESEEGQGPFEKSKNTLRVKKFRWKKLILPLCIVGGGALAAGLILANVDFTKRKSYTGSLYFTSQGQVEKIEKSSTSIVAKSDTLVYSANRTAFFAIKIPDDLKKNSKLNLVSFMSDEKAGTFAGTGYDATKGVERYVLYIWDGDGNYAKIAQSKGLIGLKYISENKEILYTTTSVVNDQGGLGDVSLNLYKLNGISNKEVDGKSNLLSNKITDVSVYESLNKIIYLSKDGELFLTDMASPEVRISIAGNVTNFETESPLADNEFVKNENVIIPSASADYIAYLDGKAWTLFNLRDNSRIDLSSANETGANFIYDQSNNRAFKMSGSGLFVANNLVDNRDESVYYESLEKDFNQTNYIWFDDDRSLLYTNRAGQLKSFSKSGEKLLDSSVEDGSLLRVQNSSGYIFKSQASLNYAATPKAKVKTLTSQIAGISEVAFFNKKLYLLTGGNLKSLDIKAGSLEEFGKCDEFWVGEN